MDFVTLIQILDGTVRTSTPLLLAYNPASRELRVGTVTVRDFADGDLGILLPAPPPSLTLPPLAGSGSDDFLTGTAANDRIESFGGNDRIRAGAGQDQVLAGTGADSVLGGEEGNGAVFVTIAQRTI